MANLNNISNMKEQINTLLRDEKKPWTRVFDIIESKTGVDRVYVFWTVAIVTTIFVVFDLAGNLISNFIAIIYPAYSSIHAIESMNKEDDTKWLTYWVVFSIVCFAEYFINYILGWFPLYWFVKSVFFIWLMIPTSFNGSLILYRKVIKPYFLQYHTTVDDAIQKAQAAAALYNKPEGKDK